METANNPSQNNEKTTENRCGGRCHGRGGRRRWIKKPFFFAAMILIKSALVMWLWNLLVPDLFHGPLVSYAQAIELTVLAKLLVGFGGGHRRFGHHRGPMMRARWAAMSEEERQKLRDEFRGHKN